MTSISDTPPPSYWNTPCESQHDALNRERREEAWLLEVRGERCGLCGGKTKANIDEGKGWVLCLNENCEYQRTEAP